MSGDFGPHSTDTATLGECGPRLYKFVNKTTYEVIMNKQMNFDLIIRISHIENKEDVSLVLKHNVKDRYQELARVLDPFNCYFGDDITLYEFGDEEMDEPIAQLISDPDTLTDWLMNEDNS